MIFGENSAKYQAYILTFWRKFAHFSHFSLYNQNQSSWFLVKIRQNTKPIALLFGENSPILATFHSTIKISQVDFWWKFGKIPSLYPYFLAKIHHFSHFSLYNQNQSSWFLVKIRQNTKPIALLFGENSPILATFHSTIKISQVDFLVKIRQNTKPIALLFGKNFANFSPFSLYNQNQSSWFLVNIWQNTKAIALLFGENSPILATFHSTIKISQVDFWWKFGKIPSL